MIRVFKTISDRVGDVFVQARVESLRVFKRFSQHFMGAQRSQLCVSVVECTFVLLPPSECVVCVHSVHHINTCVLVLVHT